jgi:hypothetical protein
MMCGRAGARAGAWLCVLAFSSATARAAGDATSASDAEAPGAQVAETQATGTAQAGAADAPTVVARAHPSEAHVGDLVTLTITTVGPRATPVNLPASIDLGRFTVIERRPPQETDLKDGRMKREFALTIASYEPGDHAVPAVEVTYLDKSGEVRTARTAELPIKIKSLLANEPEPKLRESAPPVVVMERNLIVIYAGVALAAAGIGAALALFLRRRLRARVSRRPAAPPRPAHEIALDRLDRLGAQGFPEDGDHRPFVFVLSEIIREYLGARFGFDSLELTTVELVDELRRRAGGDLVMGEIEGWLTGCDLVKFAKQVPSSSEARGALENAIRIVESTRPRPEPQGFAAAGSALPPGAPPPPPAGSSQEAHG